MYIPNIGYPSPWLLIISNILVDPKGLALAQCLFLHHPVNVFPAAQSIFRATEHWSQISCVKLIAILVSQEEIEPSVPSEAEYRDCEWVIKQSTYVRPKRVCK